MHSLSKLESTREETSSPRTSASTAIRRKSDYTNVSRVLEKLTLLANTLDSNVDNPWLDIKQDFGTRSVKIFMLDVNHMHNGIKFLRI